jgi:hypothetical protein
MAKEACSKKKAIYIIKVGINLRTKLVKCYIWSLAFMALKLGYFGM